MPMKTAPHAPVMRSDVAGRNSEGLGQAAFVCTYLSTVCDVPGAGWLPVSCRSALLADAPLANSTFLCSTDELSWVAAWPIGLDLWPRFAGR